MSAAVEYFALLRAINVGQRRVKMERLRRLWEEAGYEAVSTHLASGNIRFTADAPPEAIRGRLEQQLAAALGYPVEVFLDTRAGLQRKVDGYPWEGGPERTGWLGYWYEPLTPRTSQLLNAMVVPGESFQTTAHFFYWETSRGTGEMTFWKTKEVKTLALPLTTLRTPNSLRRWLQSTQPKPPLA